MKTQDEIRKLVSESPSFNFPYDGKIPDGKSLLVGFINYKTAVEKHGNDKVVSTIYLTPSNLYGIGDSGSCYLIDNK